MNKLATLGGRKSYPVGKGGAKGGKNIMIFVLSFDPWLNHSLRGEENVQTEFD
jgi:hypothetical protein